MSNPAKNPKLDPVPARQEDQLAPKFQVRQNGLMHQEMKRLCRHLQPTNAMAWSLGLSMLGGVAGLEVWPHARAATCVLGKPAHLQRLLCH